MSEVWGGPERPANRVRNRYHDQIVRSGHHDRLDDLDRFAAPSPTAMRYAVLWERVAANGADTLDWSWSDPRLRRLAELRMRPIVWLLHHGNGAAQSHLLDPAFLNRFAAYARGGRALSVGRRLHADQRTADDCSILGAPRPGEVRQPSPVEDLGPSVRRRRARPSPARPACRSPKPGPPHDARRAAARHVGGPLQPLETLMKALTRADLRADAEAFILRLEDEMGEGHEFIVTAEQLETLLDEADDLLEGDDDILDGAARVERPGPRNC